MPGFRQWWKKTRGDVRESEQRRTLIAEPWREEYLHLGLDGRVHGRFAPPLRRGGFSVTDSGWCRAMPGIWYSNDVR